MPKRGDFLDQTMRENKDGGTAQKIGAGEGNRTLVFSLEGCCSTIELHPRDFAPQAPATGTLACLTLRMEPNHKASPRPVKVRWDPFHFSAGFAPSARIVAQKQHRGEFFGLSPADPFPCSGASRAGSFNLRMGKRLCYRLRLRNACIFSGADQAWAKAFNAARPA